MLPCIDDISRFYLVMLIICIMFLVDAIYSNLFYNKVTLVTFLLLVVLSLTRSLGLFLFLFLFIVFSI